MKVIGIILIGYFSFAIIGVIFILIGNIRDKKKKSAEESND